MKTRAIRLLKSLVRTLGIDVVKYHPRAPGHELLDAMNSFARLRDDANACSNDEAVEFIEFCAKHWRKSKSQLFQDLFVQYELREKTGGFFVEFGAADGVHLSNSYCLEKEYGWAGVLSEPAKCWHDALRANRNCHIELRCVWDRSGERLDFTEADAAELSTVSDFKGSRGELHAASRRHSHAYKVDTVTLNDMLGDIRAPREIDYMSIDTEGSELKILSAFDFASHKIKIITIEHNYMPERRDIYDLLTRNGFRRKFELLSRWDDWYVRS